MGCKMGFILLCFLFGFVSMSSGMFPQPIYPTYPGPPESGPNLYPGFNYYLTDSDEQDTSNGFDLKGKLIKIQTKNNELNSLLSEIKEMKIESNEDVKELLSKLSSFKNTASLNTQEMDTI